MQDYQIETKCIQSGYSPENGQPRVVPIIQSTTFKYDSTEHMGKLFDLQAAGHFYTRLANPTSDAVAAKIADLEGGVGAMLLSSGQAASFYAIFNICSCGDHVVCSSTIYGGTYNLFNVTMRKMGIDFTFISPDASEAEIKAAIKPNTKAVFGETIANPALVVLDIEKFAKAAHSQGVPLIIDNTFATPIHCRPIEWGADIVIHSTTKYMDGHATSVGGCIVDSGKFNWTLYPQRFVELNTPDASYHGVIYTQQFGAAAYLTKCVVQLMRDLGASPAPMNSFLLNMGLETLHLRMERHAANALTLAKYLENHPKIASVNYPGLESNSSYSLGQKYLPKGSCGVLTFEIKGGKKDAVQFMDNLKLIAIVTHVADARSCVLHPASHTHRQLNEIELAQAGVSPEMIRFSVGIESAQDLMADIKQALA